jgi:O-antigen biosynthesis protein
MQPSNNPSTMDQTSSATAGLLAELSQARRMIEENERRWQELRASRLYKFLTVYDLFRKFWLNKPGLLLKACGRILKKLLWLPKKMGWIQGEPIHPSLQTDDVKSILRGHYKALLNQHLHSNHRLSFPTIDSEKPTVSILLVLYNSAELTYMCLQSIAALQEVSIEIVVVDNASSDQTSKLLDSCNDLGVISNRDNLHFLEGCQQAARIAKGKYLLFLNNDAQLLPGTLTSAIRTLESASDIGAVGGKVILLDGRLQEAGSIVWNDGSCNGYGRDKDPQAAPYQFQRDVDFCSGVFLLTPREQFLSMGGFDEDFKPAYYEETDYCLRLWEAGKRVVYDPTSVVMHLEFGSSVKSPKVKELQDGHRLKLVENHKNALRNHQSNHLYHHLRARQRNIQGYRILVIDDIVPHRHLGRGYPRANAILHSLWEEGCSVTFYALLDAPKQETWAEVYHDLPRTIEIFHQQGYPGLRDLLHERKGYYDIIFVSRPHNMEQFRQLWSEHPDWFKQTRIVYDAEALFCLREQRRRQVLGIPLAQEEADAMIAQELKLAENTERILTVSPQEKQQFVQRGFAQAMTLNHAVTIEFLENGFEERSDILFVACVRPNEPNEDALIWFLTEVWPLVRKQDPKLELHLVGEMESNVVRSLTDDFVVIHGVVGDLRPFYESARVFITPTRFSGGIPLKIVETAAWGLPVVATSQVANQLGWQHNQELLIADDASSFANEVLRLHSDPLLWQKLRLTARERTQREYGIDQFRQSIRSILHKAA